MKKKLKSILLVDDDNDCNFFHKRLLKKMDCVEKIYTAYDGKEALEFLQSTIDGEHPNPNIIFLDINMPRMNGWSFLDEYQKLSEQQKAQIVLVMLTTSLNPDDRNKAESYKEVKGFESKYLTQDSLTQILARFFPETLEESETS